MKKLVLIIGILLVTSVGLSQNRPCLRVMPIEELAKGATFIGRVKVVKVEHINYRGAYGQLATVVPSEVIDGDFTLKKLSILSKSNVQCADDNYVVGQEMLVFLVPADSLFTTLNFQYGQFLIANNVVRGWRDKANKPVDKLYADALKEIDCVINPTQPPPGGENNPPRPAVTGDTPVAGTNGVKVLPARPGVSPSPTPTPAPSPKRNNSD
jgi:hypothetical protein